MDNTFWNISSMSLNDSESLLNSDVEVNEFGRPIEVTKERKKVIKDRKERSAIKKTIILTAFYMLLYITMFCQINFVYFLY